MKHKYGKIFMDGVPGYCLPLTMFGQLADELDCLEIGDGLEVKVYEYTEEEVENAPEFEGW
jgi:hypothetical protein